PFEAEGSGRGILRDQIPSVPVGIAATLDPGARAVNEEVIGDLFPALNGGPVHISSSPVRTPRAEPPQFRYAKFHRRRHGISLVLAWGIPRSSTGIEERRGSPRSASGRE